MASPVSTLTCAKCGFVNEPEQVYCHNCAEKLDRSILPREEDTKTRETAERARRRVRKITNPGSHVVGREVRALIKTVLWALVVAALIQVARQPDGVPAPGAEAARPVGSEIADALDSGQLRGLVFSEPEINAYLRNAVRGKAGGGSIPGVKFERVFVGLEPGACRIGMQQSLWGYPLFSAIRYRLEIKNGNFVPTQLGGSFGRLPVSPVIMKYADFAFQSIWAALKKNNEEMGKMQSILLEKGRITLVTKAAK